MSAKRYALSLFLAGVLLLPGSVSFGDCNGRRTSLLLIVR